MTEPIWHPDLSTHTRKVFCKAFQGSHKNMGAEQLFIALLYVDPTIIRKVKVKGVNLVALVNEMRRARIAHDPISVVEILNLAWRIASGPVNNNHLLAAIVMHRMNPISQFLVESSVDIARLLQTKFCFLPRAMDIWHEVSANNPPERHCSDDRAAEIIFQLCSGSVVFGPRQTPCIKWVEKVNRSYDSPGKAEERAVRLLEEILPLDLVRMYKAKGFIEVPSLVDSKKHYRIHAANVGTWIYEKGKRIAHCCIHSLDSRLPNTDRVIAEYFQLMDEKSYLKLANVTRFV